MCSLGNFALEPQIVQNLQLGQRGNLWNADAMHNIHWYTLIPLDGPPEENDKSMPGTKSPEEALFYFERDFPHHRHLYIIPDGTAADPFGHIGRHQAQAALQCIQQAGLVTAACANCLDRGSQQSPRWRKGDSNRWSHLRRRRCSEALLDAPGCTPCEERSLRPDGRPTARIPLPLPVISISAVNLRECRRPAPACGGNVRVHGTGAETCRKASIGTASL